MELHEIIDEALTVEGTGVVNFKLLKDLLYKIVEKFENKTKSEVEEKGDENSKKIPMATIEMMYLSQRVESLHDSISRIMPSPNNIGNEFSMIQERIATLEEYVAAQTSAINDLTRAFNGIEKQVFGEVDEIESIKESLDDLRHYMVGKVVTSESGEKFEAKVSSSKGEKFFMAV